jgi:hypothetical protein
MSAIALKSDKKNWYIIGNDYCSYDTKDGKKVSYHRHQQRESVELFKDRMIVILVKASQGRKF